MGKPFEWVQRLFGRRRSNSSRPMDSDAPQRWTSGGVSGEDAELIIQLHERFEQLRQEQLLAGRLSHIPSDRPQPTPAYQPSPSLTRAEAERQREEQLRLRIWQAQAQRRRRSESSGSYPPPPIRISPQLMPLPQPRDFLRNGDAFIIDGLPAGFIVGCDAISFGTIDPCAGIRDIPPGAHFIWVSPSKTSSVRTGYWIYAAVRNGESDLGQVHIKQWYEDQETLMESESLSTPRFGGDRLAQIFQSLLPYMIRRPDVGKEMKVEPNEPVSPPWAAQHRYGQYVLPQNGGNPDEHADRRLQYHNTWHQLTSAITPRVLERITGQERASWRVTTMDRVAGDASMTATERQLYNTSATTPCELTFIFPMNKVPIDPSSEGAERTLQALDPTAWLIRRLEDDDSPSTSSPSPDHQNASSSNDNNDDNNNRRNRLELDDLVGDLQFAFLTGVHLGNLACIEQWFFVVTRLVLRAFQLTRERPRIVAALLTTLRAQLEYNDEHVDGDVFEMMPDSRRQLRIALITYRSRLQEKLGPLDDGAPPSSPSSSSFRDEPSEYRAVKTAYANVDAYLRDGGWDLDADYVRSGNVMLEDGDVVPLELDEFAAEDERGEYAPVIVKDDDLFMGF